MFKVKVFAPGKSKEGWLLEALAEYEKRLKGRMEIEWVHADPRSALKEPYLIALDVKGEPVSSEALSEKLFKSGQRLAFVIGDAEGLDVEVLEKAKWRWSLSPLTFTHQMVRLILVEQLYRALEIERNSPYHK